MPHQSETLLNRPVIPRRGARILIIDGDPDECGRCCMFLEGDGFVVDRVADAAAAPDPLDTPVPDVIIMDVGGFGADRGAGQVEPPAIATADIPVVLLVPHDMDTAALADLDTRIDACVIKPVRRRELLARVQSALRVRRRELAAIGLREVRGEQARMWTTLLDFSRSMGRALDLDEVLERLVTAAAQMTCSRRVSVMLPDETHEHLQIVKAIGIDEETRRSVRLPIGSAVAGFAFASGRRVSADESLQGSAVSGLDAEAFISVPIAANMSRASGPSVGVLNITERYGDRPFEEWELEFVDLLGGIAGSVIDDALWRQARESLLKYERDLQVARRIQQSTFPHQLPALDEFEIAAWSEPAEETGGDTYDVIGCAREPVTGRVRLSTAQAESAVLLLADATGHGIGPALSVIQVRAMLRMAIRTGNDLTDVVRQLNDQLCTDLPSGRFITAWLGVLDPAARMLTTFSCGQGPILRYDAARDAMTRDPADTVPLGIVADLDIELPPPIAMAPGDIVAVISDGILEAQSAQGSMFGVNAAATLVRQHADKPATDIVRALREQVDEFTRDAPAADDRTVLIVKRTREE